MTYETLRRLLSPVIHALWDIEVRGLAHVPRSGPVVVVANHESVLDPFVLGATIPRPLRFLGKAELWRVRPVGALLDRAGQIPVDRSGRDRDAVLAAERALEAGDAVALFPEGGVRRTGDWHRGAARMALATGAPLLPVRLVDVRKAVGRGTVGFPPLAVLIGEPVPVERAKPTAVTARELTDRVRAAVEGLGA